MTSDERTNATAWPAACLAELFRPINGAVLTYFRVIFGLAMFGWVLKNFLSGNVATLYADPVNHFHYFGFSWVQPWPGVGMHIHFLVMGVLALLIAAGLCYRVVSVLFALAMTYVFLLDRAYYLNHYYLMVLLSWTMTVIPAERVLSFDTANAGRPQSGTVPAWSLWLLRFHIGLPYFFGGIAKINSDWLQGQPMRLTVTTREWYPYVTRFVDGDLLVAIFTWGGLLLDLLIVPALLYRRTRPLALVFGILFHLTNAWVFPIGVFPWLMIAATFVFLPPERFAWITRTTPDASASESSAKTSWRGLSVGQRRLTVALACYTVLHCVLPFRHLLMEGSPNWTERGHCFAWHMMLRSKAVGLRMYITDRDTGRSGTADLRRHVTDAQMMRVGRDPEHIRQLAHAIADFYRSRGRDVEVRALALVSLNGRRPQLIIDPSVDLSRQPASWTTPDWLLPLEEPLRHDYWDVPLMNWETALGINVEELMGIRLADTAPGTSLPHPGTAHPES